MPSKSKTKGNTFEREIVNQAKELGLSAERAYASNGRSLGEHEEVDVLLEGYKIQCKRRKKLGEVIRPNSNVDMQVVREDRGDTFVILPLSKFLELLVEVSNLRENLH